MRRPRRVERILVFAFLRASWRLRLALISSQRLQRILLTPGREHWLEKIGGWRAWLVFEDARDSVPAYRDFLAANGEGDVLLGKRWQASLAGVPPTDKESYVRRYPIAARCRGGVIPARGVVIDESSGTSGEPTNWVRGAEERADGRRLLHAGLAQRFGDEPLFVINAFALGPWATGMAVSMSTVDIAILKSIGPDRQKIETALRIFGPDYRYLICGYPPFLKSLVDESSIDWAQYRCVAAVGGEGMTEGLRAHLEQAFERVYSSFGASDLEINVAAETDLAIGLRQLLAADPRVGEALGLPRRSILPMVFQYNPLDYLIEANESGEMLITICRLRNVAPKIRYNLHDLGHVVPFRDVGPALRAVGYTLDTIAADHLKLPFLFHYGRSDATVAYYGANISPLDVEEVMNRLDELGGRCANYALLVGEDERSNKQLEIAFELRAGQRAPRRQEALRRKFLARLGEINQDYREAARFIPAGYEPTLAFYKTGEGPFAHIDPRLKRPYIQSAR
jgi:phenylacetate-coenzyme A ligase PaaK-like adenylate-forming protein